MYVRIGVFSGLLTFWEEEEEDSGRWRSILIGVAIRAVEVFLQCCGLGNVPFEYRNRICRHQTRIRAFCWAYWVGFVGPIFRGNSIHVMCLLGG